MITWEIKKIFKSKNGIISIILFLILSVVMTFLKPKMAGGNYKGVEFWTVFNYRSYHPLMAFIMIIIITMIFCNIYTDEIISTVDNLILSSKNKNRTLYSKLALGIGIPVILYIVYLILQFIITYIQFGRPMNGSMQAMRLFDNPELIKDTLTIYGLTLFKIKVMIIILITFGVVASLFSFITKNSIQATSGFLIFLFLGKVITLLKFLPEKLLFICGQFNYIELIFNFNNLMGMNFGKINVFSMNVDIISLCVIMLIGILLLGIILCICTFKRFLTR